MEFDLKSWLTGFLLELVGQPLSLVGGTGEPVAWLYNGVRLPALPEWDKTTYPYALIMHYEHENDTTDTFFYVCSKPFAALDLTNKYGYVAIQVPEDGGQYMYWHYESDRDTGWMGANIPITSDTWGERSEGLLWTNTDILNEDGTVHLAASEPVPVYRQEVTQNE